MDNKELFVSFDYESYKNGKADGLNSQIDVLNMMANQETISHVKIRKERLKYKLYKLFSDVLKGIEKIEQKFPEPDIPKEIKIQSKKKKVSFEEQKISDEFSKKHRTIEEELMNVKKQLALLNGQVC